MPCNLEGAEGRPHREAVHVPIGHYRVLHLVVWGHDHCWGEYLCYPPLGWRLIRLSRHEPCRPEAQEEQRQARSHAVAGGRQCPVIPIHEYTTLWLLASVLLYHVLISCSVGIGPACLHGVVTISYIMTKW